MPSSKILKNIDQSTVFGDLVYLKVKESLVVLLKMWRGIEGDLEVLPLVGVLLSVCNLLGDLTLNAHHITRQDVPRIQVYGNDCQIYFRTS